MKLLIKTMCFLVLLAFLAWAQNPVYYLPISVSPPAPVSNVSVQVSGTAGQTFYCYWVVAQYTVGSVIPSAPACVYNAPNTLNGSNYDVVSWTATGGGSPTFAVLRCTPTAYGGTCAFPGTGTTAVTASTSSLTANDQSNSLNSYTYTNAGPATFTLQMNNRDVSTPALRILDNNGNSAWQLQQTSNGNGIVTGNLGQFTTTSPYTQFTTISPPNAIATNSTTNTNGGIFWSAIFIPTGTTLTGACILNGITVGTDKRILALYSAGGNLLANTATAGTTTATASKYQCIAFTATVTVAGPQTYFLASQANGTTDNFQTYAASSVPTGYVTGTQAGTFGTLAAITPGTSFTANDGPLMMVY